MTSALILAAGASRRMGAENKLLLPYGPAPLLAHIVRTVRAASVGEVVVVLGHEADRVRAALADAPVVFAVNPDYAEGMTTSIHAGVRAAAPGATGFMICLADLPLLTPADLDRLLAAFAAALVADARAIVVPVFAGQRGNPVLFSSVYRPELLAERGRTGCKNLLRQHPAHVVEVLMPNDHCLRDIDTPEAYARLHPPGDASD